MAYPSDLARTKDWGTEILTDADLEGQLDVIINWVMAMVNLTTGHDHSAVANKGPRISPATGLAIASQAAADLLVASSSTAWKRLAKGTSLQVLRMNVGATDVEWGTPVGAEDAIVRGFELVYSSAAALIVNAGTLYHGATKIAKTANTTLTKATAADWWDGAVDSYAGGANWCYVGVDVSGNIKFLGNNPPDCADSAGNTDGTKYYWYDGTLYWRVLMAVWVHTDNTFTKNWVQYGNYVEWDVPIQVTTTKSAGAWSAAVSCTTGMPAISTRAIFGVKQLTAGTEGYIRIKKNGGTYNTNLENAVGSGIHNAAGELTSMTDASQQISHYENADVDTMAISVKGYFLNVR